MVSFGTAISLASLLTLAVAAPVADPVVTPAPKSAIVDKRATSCTFTEASAASASIKSCATAVLDNIAVPAGETLDLSGASDNTHIIFSGTTTFGYKEWQGPLISAFAGTGITITGAPGHVIDGNGPKWWDGHGGNGGKAKPSFFSVCALNSSTIEGLNIKNTPRHTFGIEGCTGLTINSVTIDNSAGDQDGLGHNTDAFDIAMSTDLTISNAVVHNQDDCVGINSGSNILFTDGTCVGGHGLSLAVGVDNGHEASNITFTKSKISNSQFGVRIKNIYGGTGLVKDVTYSDITLSGVSQYGIVIEQDYKNSGPTGTPTNGVPITDLTLDGVSGDVGIYGKGIYVLCASGACSDWKWDNVNVTGGQLNSCTNAPSGVSC